MFAAAAEAGANNLSGPIWQLSDNTKALSEALAQASAQVRAKAEAFAAANGVTLGDVLVLTEGYSSPVYYYRTRSETATTPAGAGVYAPPINPQNLDIYINATITYQLKRQTAGAARGARTTAQPPDETAGGAAFTPPARSPCRSCRCSSATRQTLRPRERHRRRNQTRRSDSRWG